jgi:CHAT domain-containing protein
MRSITTLLITLLLILSSAAAWAEGISLEEQLRVKKKVGMAPKAEMDIDQVVIDIYKLIENESLTTEQKNGMLPTLIASGEAAWTELLKLNPYFASGTFPYGSLSYAITDYYYATNQVYKTADQLQKLAEKAYDANLLDVSISARIKLTDVYLSTGQFELANATIAKVKEDIYLFYEPDYSGAESNTTYGIIANSRLMTLLIRYSMLSSSVTLKLEDVQRFYDLMLQMYDLKYITPYMTLTGTSSMEIAFFSVSEKTIKDKQFRQDWETLYLFAKYFATHGDNARADQALQMSVDALTQNVGVHPDKMHTVLEVSFISKMANSGGGLSAYASDTAKKATKYKFIYYSHLYPAVIHAIQGKTEQANKDALEAEETLQKAYSYYRQLASEFLNKDKIKDTYPDLLISEAKVYTQMKDYQSAVLAYNNLITTYEEYRNSLPVELRRGFFRGYSKDAYLGLIKAQAANFIMTKSKANYDSFLSAMDMLTSRQLKDLQPEYASATPTVAAIQSKLATDEMVYILLDVDDSNIAAGISKNSFDIYNVPKQTKFFDKIMAARNDLAEKHIYDKKILHDLTAEITSPLQSYKGVKKVLLMADGAVSALPFDILPYGDGMVFDSFRVENIVALSNITPDTIKLDNFLGIADPTYKVSNKYTMADISPQRSMDISGYFAPLPETRDEISTISKLFSANTILTGASASETSVKSIPLAVYNVIHFATHGILGGELPDMDEPALVLSAEPTGDSLLSTSEISKLDIKADMVVLSACNTGSGKYYRGEGVTGIARAFKLAGAQAVTASLWQVDSYATKSLMELFYQNIKNGMIVSDALYAAKKALRSSDGSNGTDRALKKAEKEEIDDSGYANPYYWSAFVLIK